MFGDLMSLIWDAIVARPLLRRAVFAAILFGLLALFGFSWSLVGLWSFAFVMTELTEWLFSTRKS
jgi:hypothetical protein